MTDVTNITGTITDEIIKKFLSNLNDDIQPVVSNKLSDLSVGELTKLEHILVKLSDDKFKEITDALNKVQPNEKMFKVDQQIKLLVDHIGEHFKPKSILKKDHYKSGPTSKHVRFSDSCMNDKLSTSTISMMFILGLIIFLLLLQQGCRKYYIRKWNMETSKNTTLDGIVNVKERQDD